MTLSAGSDRSRLRDLRPYEVIPAKIDLEERNAKTAYRASDSDRMDFCKPDRAPMVALNDIIETSTLRTRHMVEVQKPAR